MNSFHQNFQIRPLQIRQLCDASMHSHPAFTGAAKDEVMAMPVKTLYEQPPKILRPSFTAFNREIILLTLHLLM